MIKTHSTVLQELSIDWNVKHTKNYDSASSTSQPQIYDNMGGFMWEVECNPHITVNYYIAFI